MVDSAGADVRQLTDSQSGTRGNQVCLATPTGRGAVATILATGDACRAAIASFFDSASGKTTDEILSAANNSVSNEVRKIRPSFGVWSSRTTADVEIREEVVLLPLAADHIELHCHGGAIPAAAILSSFEQVGFQPLTWNQWLERGLPTSFESEVEPSSPLHISARARQLLSDCATLTTSSILLDQVNGAWHRLGERLRRELEAANWKKLVEEVGRLRRLSVLGEHLVKPFRVVLAGPPNVGKSSLLNAIVGFERAIVFDQPGTTRDSVFALTAIEGWPIEIADTAGIRITPDQLETQGIERTWKALAEADLILWVEDLSGGGLSESGVWQELKAKVLASITRPETRRNRHRSPLILIGNKSDLVSPEEIEQAWQPHSLEWGDSEPVLRLEISARTGEGLERLLANIGRSLGIEPIASCEAVPFTEELSHWVQQLHQAAEKQDSAAISELLRLIDDCG